MPLFNNPALARPKLQVVAGTAHPTQSRQIGGYWLTEPLIESLTTYIQQHLIRWGGQGQSLTYLIQEIRMDCYRRFPTNYNDAADILQGLGFVVDCQYVGHGTRRTYIKLP